MEGLSVICAGLGLPEEDEEGNRIGYSKDRYCLENLKDLLRFLRRDDPQTREAFKQVCRWNTVSKDLIPIIQYCQDDRNLVLNAVKVLVFLTMPIEPLSHDTPQQMEYLWGLKSAISASDTVAVVVSLLETPLEHLESESFNEDDWKLVQLLLTLFRNILAIYDFSMLQKSGGSTSQFLSLRDNFLELLFRENVMDLIILITQHVDGPRAYFRHDSLLLLEIFHYIFIGQDPELIAKVHLKDSKVGEGNLASLDSLKSIMMEEKEKRRLSRHQKIGRHSQFSGTFTRLGLDGSKAVYNGNPNSASCSFLHKTNKPQRGPIKKIVWDHGTLPSTDNNILELLHDFLNQFMSGGYNVLMQMIRENIEKEHHSIQNTDVVVFFKVAQFVSSFQYHKILISKVKKGKETSEVLANDPADNTLFKGSLCGPIAESMNESMFLLVISRWRNAFDGLKETNNYKFLSAAGSLMKMMIRMLDLVLTSLPEDSKEPQTARILLYKLFYDQTDQGMTQFLLSLIKSFDTHKQTKSDLADLVEMIYVILQLMNNLQTRGTMRVSKKSRKMRKNKVSSEKKELGNEVCGDETLIQAETVISNTELSTDLPNTSQANLTSDHQPNINAAAKIDDPEILVTEMENLASEKPQMDNRKINDNDLSRSSDDSSSDEQPAATCEVDFKVSTFVSAFANHSIIQNLCWLLKFYKSNPINLNQYIICMLQKITDELELSPMLYQLSLLTIFYEILDEQKSCPGKEYASVVDFLTTLIRRMLRKMKNQPLLFVEVLFWKSRKECHYINAEYLLHELGHMKKETATWGNVSVNGELGPSQTNGWVPRSIADALGEDEADVVISHERGDKGGEDAVDLENEGVSKRKRRLVLTDELEMKIKDLYEKFKDDKNCSRLIAESLGPGGQVSPAQVFNKLKQLGLKGASKRRKHNGDGPFASDSDFHGEKGRVLEKESDGPFASDSDFHGEKGRVLEKESDLHSSTGGKGSLRSQSLSTRKRVSAFTNGQEEMIKVLFEQFKYHKRCSRMIANALAADNSIKAAQVSRKLKQLGLQVPKKPGFEADMHLRDEEIDEFISGKEQDSDDETLLSLKNRRKGNKDIHSSGKGSPKQNIEEDFSGDSDVECLSSILKKTRRLPEAEDEKLAAAPTETKVTEKSYGNGVPTWTEAEFVDEDIPVDHAIQYQDVTSEAEAAGRISGSLSEISPTDKEMDDILTDEVDGASSGASVTGSALRRKLRMVIDVEDDD